MAALNRRWMRLARNAWDRHGVAGVTLWTLLWPWSVAFRLVIRIRNALFNARWLRTRKLELPVVSVGNLTVGGTGKTPTTLWLARNLQRRGLRAAILIRGYGAPRTEDRPVRLDPDTARGWLEGPGSRPLEHGDEAVMMSALYDQTVGVGADRYRVGVELERDAGNLQLFLMDDGFQHRRLERDLDLLLLGSDHGGSVLPAGPFREPLRGLERADILMVTGAHDRWRELLRGRWDDARVFYAFLEPRAVMARTEGRVSETTLGTLAGTGVLAVSAVANPGPFYEMVRDCGATIVDTLEYPDHHGYSEKDWREINRHRNGVEKIVTTEKDFVKLVRFPFPGGKLLALRVEMSIDRPEALLDRITQAVERARRKRPDPGDVRS